MRWKRDEYLYDESDSLANARYAARCKLAHCRLHGDERQQCDTTAKPNPRLFRASTGFLATGA